MNPTIDSPRHESPGIQLQPSGSPASGLQGRDVASGQASPVSRSDASSAAVQAVPIGNRTVDTPTTPGAIAKAARDTIKSTVISELMKSPDANLATVSNAISDRSAAMFKDVKATANTQGTVAYAFSFGVPGVAARVSGTAVGIDTGNAKTALAVGGTMAATMPLMHGFAGAIATPSSEKTQFVVPSNGAATRPLPDNFVGNAFKPFSKYLGLGNPVIQTIGLAAATVAKSGGRQAAVINSIKIGTDVALAGPGVMAARETVRNIYSAKADAGFSFRESISNASGKAVGTLETHQELCDPATRSSMGGNVDDTWQEVGRIKLDKPVTTTNAAGIEETHQQTFTISIVKSENSTGNSVYQLDLENPEGVGVPDKATTRETIKNALQKSMAWPTVPKMIGLGVAIAQAAGINMLIGDDLVDSLKCQGMPDDNAAITAGSVKFCVGSLLLASHFIPIFMAATAVPHSQAGVPPSASDTTAHRLGQVFEAVAPVVGPISTFRSGKTNPSLVTSLKSESLSGIGARNVEMLQGISKGDDAIKSAVTQNSNGSLQIDGTALMAILEQKLGNSTA